MTGFTFDTLLDSVLKEMTKAGLEPVTQYEDVPRLQSGSLAVDWALSGGWPRGRYSMIYGEEGSGKSTLFFIAAAHLMRNDPNALVGFIETGGEATDPMWLHRIGIDMRRFVHIQPETTEAALNALRIMTSKKMFSLICLDSIAAMASIAEVNKEIGDTEWAMTARLLNDYFKRDAMQLQKADITKRDLKTGEILGTEPPPAVLLVNQVREAQTQHGDPERIPGGRQLRHACSIILRAKKPNQKEIALDSDGNISVIEHNIKVKKNKVGPPFREAQYHVRNDKRIKFFGVDIVREAVDLAVQFELLKGASGKKWSTGACYLFGEELPIDYNQLVPEGRTKGRFCLEMLMYGNDEIYAKVLTAVLESIAASRYDDSLASLQTEFLQEQSGDLPDVLPGVES